MDLEISRAVEVAESRGFRLVDREELAALTKERDDLLRLVAELGHAHGYTKRRPPNIGLLTYTRVRDIAAGERSI